MKYQPAKFFMVLVALCMAVQPLRAEQVSDADWIALQAIQATLTKNGCPLPWNFTVGKDHADNLKGVVIRDNHVVELHLNSCGLKGDIPWTVFGLPQLERLDLSNNRLTGDVANGLMVVLAQNKTATAYLKSLNLSNNRLTGNVGKLAYCCKALQELNVSGNCIADVAPMVSKSVALDISKQTIDRVVSIDLSNLNPQDLLTQVPTVVVYNHEKQIYDPQLTALATTADLTDFDMAKPETFAMILSYINQQLGVAALSNHNDYHGSSGDTLNVMLLNTDKQPTGTTFKIKLQFAEGDANFDGKINALDLQTIILWAFDKYNTYPFNFTAANRVNDMVINVQDVVEEVNLLLSASMGTVSSAPAKAAVAAESSAVATAQLSSSNGKLVLSTRQPVAAMDVWIDHAQTLQLSDALKAQGLACAYSQDGQRLHAVVYSLLGALLPVGTVEVGQLTGSEPAVLSATLADEAAQPLPVAVLKGTTGLEPATTAHASASWADGKLMITAHPQATTRWTVTTLTGQTVAHGTLLPGTQTVAQLDLTHQGVCLVTLKAAGKKRTQKLLLERK